MTQKIINLYREAYSGLPRPVWLLSLIMLINRTGTMVIIFFVLYLTNVFEFSNKMAGAIISFSAVGGILGALFGGWFSDRFGAIRSQIIFLTLVSVQFFLTLLADSLIEISLALFVLMFLGEAVRPAVHAACLDFCEPEDQKRSMGLLRLAVNLGMAIGPVIGGFLAQYELWNWLFILDGLSCLISACLLYLVFGFRAPELEIEKITEGRGLPDKQPSKVSTAAQSPWRDRHMLTFGLLYLLTITVFIQFGSTFVKYLQEVHGFSESTIGLISGINPVLIVAFEMVIIKSIERYATLKMIAIGSLLVCLGFGSLPFGPTAYFCIVSMFILTLGEILAFPLTAAYAAELSNESNRGQYMGFITVIFSLSMIIGPFLGLTLYDIDPNLPWYVSLVVGLVVFPCLWNMQSQTEGSQALEGQVVKLAGSGTRSG